MPLPVRHALWAFGLCLGFFFSPEFPEIPCKLKQYECMRNSAQSSVPERLFGVFQDFRFHIFIVLEISEILLNSRTQSMHTSQLVRHVENKEMTRD